jgi:hypothetical protein
MTKSPKVNEQKSNTQSENHGWFHDRTPRQEYVAGKWGRFLRAPDLYFQLIDRFSNRFVPLGTLVRIRFGVKTGCDAFFMPRDVTREALSQKTDEGEFKALTGCSRKEAENGSVRIIRDGGGTIHSLESKYLRPEVHSLMKVARPVVTAKDLDRVVLLVDAPLSALRGTYVYKYLKYGELVTYSSGKAKGVPIPQRSTCAARDPWYDLTKLVKPGFAFWPMSQQYRHIIPGNPERLICNHNLFDLSSEHMTEDEQTLLLAVLNSTLIGLFKTFYGRFAGTEGNLKTEVLDVRLIDVPDPRFASPSIAKSLKNALHRMSKRTVGRLVEESFMECHSYERALGLASRPLTLARELQQSDRRELDEAVFQLLGASSQAETRMLTDELYTETAAHFRAIRVTEIQKMEDRANGDRPRFSATEQAIDAWDALDLTDVTPLSEWVRAQTTGPTVQLYIPELRPVYLTSRSMFDNETVYFGSKRQEYVVCPSTGTAQLLTKIAELGVSGLQVLPSSETDARRILERLDARYAAACQRLKELAESRTSEPEIQNQVFGILQRWFVLGRAPTGVKVFQE